MLARSTDNIPHGRVAKTGSVTGEMERERERERERWAGVGGGMKVLTKSKKTFQALIRT